MKQSFFAVPSKIFLPTPKRYKKDQPPDVYDYWSSKFLDLDTDFYQFIVSL